MGETSKWPVIELPPNPFKGNEMLTGETFFLFPPLHVCQIYFLFPEL